MVNKEKTLEELYAEMEQAQKAYTAAKKLDEQKKKEEVERKKAELAAEKGKRKKEVDDAIENAVELIKKYMNDYGNFSITSNVNDLSFLFGGKPWRLFF